MKSPATRRTTLSTQLYGLVGVLLAILGAQTYYMARQVTAADAALKFTIENRLKTSQFLQDISNALLVSLDTAHGVARRSAAPSDAYAKLRPEIDTARRNWDAYLRSSKIPEEEGLAASSTETVERGFGEVERLLGRLQSGDVAGLDLWTAATLAPVTTEVETRLEKLVVLQARAADLDQARVQADSRAVVRNTWIAAGAAATCAGLLAFLIIRSMMRRLGADPGAAAEVANRIADGDYDFDLDSRPGDASLLGALARMKGSLAQSRLDYEGQLQAIGKAQCVVEFSLDGTILAANANFLKFSGHTLEELKGRHHSTLLDEADRSSAGYRTFWARMKNGEFTAGQYKRIVRDGSERWLQATYNPILGADGRPFKVVKYATDITAQRGADALNAAFRGALDKLRTNVMVADNDCDIIYLNESANELMREVESDFRTALPNFDAKRLVGQSIDAFHREPRHQRRMLAGLTSTHVIETTIGGRVMKAVINPMSDGAGRRLGSVIEWFDRTQEMATERELQGVIAAVKDGELDRRIDLAGKTGFFETLSRGINGLVDDVGTVVTEVQELVESANTGDLTRRMHVDGKAGLLVKIGSGINQLTGNLATVVSQVKHAAGEVSRGADELSQGNTNLSQRTEEQASSLEETASSMEQMTSTVKQNADNAGQANQLAVAARDQAERGGAVVAKAVRAMAGINEASTKIADIIGVIDEIAFQTNLLALNAAVEAARAGEQGRGFAVVASEVRNLAGRSATAAKEIKSLIQDSVRKVDEGSSLVTQSGATLDQIVAAVKKVTDIVAEIAAASNEQSSGIDQVNKAVAQLDQLTQQNAALVEQASAASQAMAEQARGLHVNMSRYRVQSSAPPEPDRPVASGPLVERRRGTRPWTRTAQAGGPVTKAVASASRNDDDGAVWKEF